MKQLFRRDALLLLRHELGGLLAVAGFDSWLTETATRADAEERNARLAQWSKAPFARACHPREEHLLPLMVVAGVAGADVGRRVFHGEVAGKPIPDSPSGQRRGASGLRHLI